MPETARFRYVQARLQARHGDRADERVWRRLDSIGNLANYLQTAGHTTLRIWTNGLHEGNSSHEIELALRRNFRSYVAEIARWQPARWAVVVRPLAQLPDLPALQHLLGGGTAPAWMLDDPELRACSSESLTTRAAALETAGLAYLADAWQRGIALPQAWHDHWRSQWPKAPQLTAGLKHLGELLIEQTREVHSDTGTQTDRLRERLLHRLTAAFRRYSFQPAAACAHIGIVALELERLRADLIERAVFAESMEASP